MNPTPIAWTDFTSNPIYAVSKETGKRGWFCEKVSPGCAHCYAATMNEAARFRGNGLAYLPKNADKIEWRLDERELDAILRRKKPAKIFLGDMIDLFHEDIPRGYLGQVFQTMAHATQHTFQILTKRPERMQECFGDYAGVICDGHMHPWPLPNVWLGVSVENQHFANERIPLLLETPAAVRFLSCEPLLRPIDISQWLTHDWRPVDIGEELQRIDWVIIGGESNGPKRRYMDPAWAHSLVDQCRDASVPIFYKQDSGSRPGVISQPGWPKEFPYLTKQPQNYPLLNRRSC